MELSTAQAIVQAAEEQGLEGVELRESYSGRGMYGKSTSGVTCDSLGEFAQALGALMVEANFEAIEAVGEDLLNNGVATDSMGTGVIIY